MNGNHEWITQIGAGGAFLLICLQMLLNFLKGRNSKKNGSSGERDPSYWTIEIRRIIDEAVRPLLEKQNRMLENQTRMMEELLRRQRGRS